MSERARARGGAGCRSTRLALCRFHVGIASPASERVHRVVRAEVRELAMARGIGRPGVQLRAIIGAESEPGPDRNRTGSQPCRRFPFSHAGAGVGALAMELYVAKRRCLRRAFIVNEVLDAIAVCFQGVAGDACLAIWDGHHRGTD